MNWKRLLSSLMAAALLAGPAWSDVIYSVRQGDSLEKIGKAYGLTIDQILEANPELSAESAEAPGALLIIPEKDDIDRPEVVEETLDDPILTAGVQHDPPAATVIEIEGNPALLNGSDATVIAMNRSGDRYRRPALNSRRGRLLHGITGTARRFMGVPYRMGGTTSRAFDCSGFVMRVFLIHGIKLPRTADVQYNAGQKVPRGQEQPGDLVFFETYLPGPSHVGIYMGNDQFIHASSSRGVTISSLKQNYYRNRYLGAKRVL